MPSFSITWSVSDPDPHNNVMVRCHLDGTDHTQEFGPMPVQVSDAFIRAKRQWLDTRIRSMTDAVKLFTPTPRRGGIIH